jgi:prepilin-type processing-associated H-X9-DG protein
VLLAADPPQPKSATPDLQLVPRGAYMFAHVRVGQVWDGPLGRQVRADLQKSHPAALAALDKLLGVPVAAIDTITAVWPTTHGKLLDESAAVIVSLNRPADRKELLAALTKGEDDREGLPEGFYKLKNDLTGTLHLAGGRRFTVFTDGRARTDLYAMLLGGGGPGGLDDALAEAAKGHTAVIGFRPDLIKQFAESERGPGRDAQMFLPLLDAESFTAVADLGTSLRLEVTARYPGKGGALKAEQAAKTLLTLARGALAIELQRLPKERAADRKMLEVLSAAVGAARLERADAALRLGGEFDAAALAVAAADAATKAGTASARVQSQNNLKQIAIAMHNYHDSIGSFPPAAVCDRQGKPLLSWRVTILPYVEEQALYEQFHLDEPWDSEHNKKLIAQMPKIYAHPEGGPREAGKTHYRVFVGGGAGFELRKGVKITDITDGTSNTLMAVETAEGVPWTKPEDLPYDPRKVLPKFGLTGEGFNAAFFDGSVRFIQKGIKEQTLRQLITRAGNEVINDDF